MRDVPDNVAVVTGGAGGIGRSFVNTLLGEHARVITTGVDDTAGRPPSSQSSPLGMTGRDQDRRLQRRVRRGARDAVFDRHTAWDLFCNNAGVTSGGGRLCHGSRTQMTDGAASA